jgi:hypothetical protein
MCADTREEQPARPCCGRQEQTEAARMWRQSSGRDGGGRRWRERSTRHAASEAALDDARDCGKRDLGQRGQEKEEEEEDGREGLRENERTGRGRELVARVVKWCLAQ